MMTISEESIPSATAAGRQIDKSVRGMTEVSSVSEVGGEERDKRQQLCLVMAGARVRPATIHRMACCDATPLKNMIGDCD